MEKIVEIGLRESLLRDLNIIAIRYGVTKERWIKETYLFSCDEGMRCELSGVSITLSLTPQT